jgi:hypothetical protein
MTIAERMNGRLASMKCGAPALREELARRGLAVTRQSVHAWLSGETKPTPANLLVILDALAIPMAEHAEWLSALALPATRVSREVA